MEAEDAPDDEGPLLPFISPDDRLWRHPSEMRMYQRSESTPAPAPAESRRDRPGSARLWTVAVVAGVVGAVLASGVGVATGSFDAHTTVLQPVTKLVEPTAVTVSANQPASAQNDENAGNPDWPAITDSIAPSIVSIASSGPDGEEVGSGVLYTSVGDRAYILTASGLVGDGPIKVTFDDDEAQVAHLVGIDRETGLGLVSVPGSKRIFPPFIEESALQVAQPVLGVGAQNADGSPDVSTGSISALDVAVTSGDDSTMENLIDVDTSNSPTDQGAALVDSNGAVFGIEASVSSPGEDPTGQTYAIPYDVADHVASQMLAGVTVTHPWLGTIDSRDPSSATASELNLGGGSQVTQVSPDSPAQAAGMQPSDIITSFDGHPVASTGALTALVSSCNPGHTATITFIHQGAPRSAIVTLANAPADVDLGAASSG